MRTRFGTIEVQVVTILPRAGTIPSRDGTIPSRDGTILSRDGTILSRDGIIFSPSHFAKSTASNRQLALFSRPYPAQSVPTAPHPASARADCINSRVPIAPPVRNAPINRPTYLQTLQRLFLATSPTTATPGRCALASTRSTNGHQRYNASDPPKYAIQSTPHNPEMQRLHHCQKTTNFKHQFGATQLKFELRRNIIKRHQFCIRPLVLISFFVITLPLANAAAVFQESEDSTVPADETGLERVELRGKVVADRSVVLENAKLKSCYLRVMTKYPQASIAGLDPQNQPPESVLEKNGEFELARLPQPMLFCCETADGKFAGAAQIDDKDDVVIIQLRPVKSVRARLLDPDTGEPLVDKRVIASIHYRDPNDGVQQNKLLGWVATTDENGLFEISGLVADQQYDLAFFQISEQKAMLLYSLGTFMTDSLETQELGDVDSLRGWFASDAMPISRFAESIELAKATKQNLLVIFSTPTDPALHEFARLKADDDEFRRAMENFRLIAVDFSDSQIPSASALAAGFGVQLAKEKPELHFCCVDTNGDLMGEEKTNGHDGQIFPRDRLLEMLVKNSPQPPDAQELFNDSLRLANSDNRLVLLQESGANCGPCVNMHRFLEATRGFWTRDFVWIELDQRWPGTEEITGSLRGGKESTIPWYAILDSDGNALATSIDKAGKNMGFPASPESNSYFQNMIKEHATRMTNEDISAMLRELKK